MTGQHAMTVSRKRGGGSGPAASSTQLDGALRVYTLPGRHSWPWLSAPLPELRKLHAALRRGGVRGVLLDTGAYRLMVRGGARTYPGGWLERYYQSVKTLSSRAREAGARSVLYVVPDIPYDPARSSRLAGWWMESFHPGLLGHAIPIIVLHPACRDTPGCYREGLEHYRRLLGGHVYDSLFALVQLDRRQPGLSAKAIVHAASLAQEHVGAYTRIHLLGATLRLAKQLSGSCIPGLASADTSSWYWDRYYGRPRSPGEYLSRVAMLLGKAAGCSRGVAPLTRWLPESPRHASIVGVSGGG